MKLYDAECNAAFPALKASGLLPGLGELLYVIDPLDRDKFSVFVKNQFENAVHAIRLNHGTQNIGREAYGTAIGGAGLDRNDMAFVIMDELVRWDVEYDQLALMHDGVSDGFKRFGAQT